MVPDRRHSIAREQWLRIHVFLRRYERVAIEMEKSAQEYKIQHLSITRSQRDSSPLLFNKEKGRGNEYLEHNGTAVSLVAMAMLENIERELSCRSLRRHSRDVRVDPSLVLCIHSMAVQRTPDGNYHLDFDQIPFYFYSSIGNFTELMRVFL